MLCTHINYDYQLLYPYAYTMILFYILFLTKGPLPLCA